MGYNKDALESAVKVASARLLRVADIYSLPHINDDKVYTAIIVPSIFIHA